MDTGLFTGRQRMSDAWQAFRDFVERTEDLPVWLLVRGACAIDPATTVVAAYDAPFPTPASKAGARAFPLMLPTSPDDPGAAAGQAAADGSLRGDARPTLCLWADSDPIIPLGPASRRRAPQPERRRRRSRTPRTSSRRTRASRSASGSPPGSASSASKRPGRKRGGHLGRPVRQTWISDPGYFFFCLHFDLNVAFVGV